MKKNLITTLIIGATLSFGGVFADDRDDVKIPSSPDVSSVSHVNEKEEFIASSTPISRMKSRGAKLIKERIQTLQSNQKAIEGAKNLTAEQKNVLLGILTKNITDLNTLSSSVASSTDATSTKSLVNSIFTTYRIYGIVIPQVRLEKRVYDLQNHSQKLSDTFIKVQTKIDEAKTKGKDVTVWQKSLDDAKILVANDMNTLANLSTKILALTPESYGTSTKATIESINKDLKVVAKDFNSIAKNLKKPAVMKNSSTKNGTSTEEFRRNSGTSTERGERYKERNER